MSAFAAREACKALATQAFELAPELAKDEGRGALACREKIDPEIAARIVERAVEIAMVSEALRPRLGAQGSGGLLRGRGPELPRGRLAVSRSLFRLARAPSESRSL